MLLARFGCNNHTICDEELRPIGLGIYPLGAPLAALLLSARAPSPVPSCPAPETFAGTGVECACV